jgi:hypothetical protein
MATFLGRYLILTDPASQWAAVNPVLMDGELGVSDPGSATPILKVGDGSRPWSALPPISGAGGGASTDYVVGTTDTLPPGSFATVTIDNLVNPPTISFGIPSGAVGPPNTLAIGTTTTGLPGSPASATITGAAPNQTLSLVIPQGPVGPPGEDGADGSTGPAGAAGAAGPANTLTIGVTTTGAPGSAAAATITGAAPNQVLNLTIPTGAQGPQGIQGIPGTPGGSANLADPSATIGLVMIPGVSPNALRSDGAPALSQTIQPVWTNTHTFTKVPTSSLTGCLLLSCLTPILGIRETGAGVGAKVWDLLANAGIFAIRTGDDTGLANKNIIASHRVANAIDYLHFGNATDNPAYNFLGTGVVTLGGTIRGPNGTAALPTYSFTGDPATGIYEIGAYTIGFSFGGVRGFALTPTAQYNANGSAGGPSITFENDSGSGMWLRTPGTLSFSASSANAMELTPAGVYAASFNSSSGRAVKRETGSPSRVATILARLRPILYRLLVDETNEQLGLIAEEVHEACPQLSDGKTVAYDRLAILLLADWQESRGVSQS